MTDIQVTVRVNHVERTATTEPRRLLSDFLRDELGMTGTNVGCEHGVCGACTVLLNGESVRSCLMFAVQAQGAELETVEGLAHPDGMMHPIQQAFTECHALQCGFCTPGFLMTVKAFLGDNPEPTAAEIRLGISGNLCRCTGYQHIVEAVQLASQRLRECAPSAASGSVPVPKSEV
jgi:carbon-monoxide dehydrogenase small subunit